MPVAGIASLISVPQAGRGRRGGSCDYAGLLVPLVAGAHHIQVVPSFQCGFGFSKTGHDLYQANMELMLAAARANVPTNTVYSARESYGVTWRDLLREPSRAGEMLRARRDDYCKREIERAQRGGRPGDVFVLLSDRPRPGEMVPGVTCSSFSWARYCIHPALARVGEPGRTALPNPYP